MLHPYRDQRSRRTAVKDLVDFLRAHLDEDEQVARAAPQGEPFDGQWVVALRT